MPSFLTRKKLRCLHSKLEIFRPSIIYARKMSALVSDKEKELILLLHSILTFPTETRHKICFCITAKCYTRLSGRGRFIKYSCWLISATWARIYSVVSSVTSQRQQRHYHNNNTCYVLFTKSSRSSDMRVPVDSLQHAFSVNWPWSSDFYMFP